MLMFFIIILFLLLVSVVALSFSIVGACIAISKSKQNHVYEE